MSITKIIYDQDDDSTGTTGKKLSEYEKVIKKIEEMKKAEEELTELQLRNLKIIGTRRQQQSQAAKEKINNLREFAKMEEAALNDAGQINADQMKMLKETLGLKEEAINQLAKEGKLRETLLVTASELEESDERRNEYARDTDKIMESVAEKIGVGNSRMAKTVKASAAFLSNMADAEYRAEALNSALDTFSALNIAGSLLTNIISLATEVDKLGAEMTKATGIGKEFESQLAKVSLTALENEISLDQMSTGMMSVQQNLIDSIGTSIASQEATAMQVAEFTKLGLEAESVTTMMNNMNKSMGVGTQESLDLIKELSVSAVELGIGPKKMADGFLKASSVLDVHGKKSIDVFKGLAVAARNAGTSVDSLVAIAGKFDTFSDAADAAGKLNAILGSTMSATEMLMMKEDERIETLIQTVQASGQQFSQMDRFKQKAIAQAAGISDMSEANRIFGMSLQAYRDQEAQTKKSEDVQNKFNKAIENVIPIATKLTMAFQRMAVSGDFVNNVISAMEMGLGLVSFLADIFSSGWKTVTALLIYAGIQLAFVALQGYAAGAGMAAAGAGGTTGATGVGLFGKAAEMGAPGLLAFGFAALMVGGGIALAAYGLGTFISSFKGLDFTEVLMAAGALVLLGVAAYGVAAGLASMANPFTTAGVLVFAALATSVGILAGGIGLLIDSFGLFNNELIQPIFASGEAAVEVASAIDQIVNSMNKIPDKKLFSSTLENIALITTGKSAGITQASSDVRDSIFKVSNNQSNSFKITLEIDGKEFNTKVKEITTDTTGYGSTPTFYSGDRL